MGLDMEVEKQTARLFLCICHDIDPNATSKGKTHNNFFGIFGRLEK